MTSRERVIAAINHQEPDRIPVDFGASYMSGINTSALYRLRKRLGLEEKPVEVFEIVQMLGTVDEDVRRALGGDVIGLRLPHNHFGVDMGGELKTFTMPDGTPTLIQAKNELEVRDDGSIVIYPRGNKNYPPSGIMTKEGYFFDAIWRETMEEDIEDCDAREDYKDYFTVFTDEEARWLEKEAKRLDEETDYAVIADFGRGNLGSSFFYAGAAEYEPKGIRSYTNWSMAQLLNPEYCEEVFEMQTENVIKNLEIYKQACGDRIQVIAISGTDFGSQTGPLLSNDLFRELYKPYFKRMNDWVHENTNWKTWYHCCGSIMKLLDDFIDMGVDILNPVQCSANNMDAQELKDRFGDKLVFWGGGIDTQKVMAKGTTEEIRTQVQERMKILGKGGGYVFATEHNIMGDVDADRIVACFEAVKAYSA